MNNKIIRSILFFSFLSVPLVMVSMNEIVVIENNDYEWFGNNDEIFDPLSKGIIDNIIKNTHVIFQTRNTIKRESIIQQDEMFLEEIKQKNSDILINIKSINNIRVANKKWNTCFANNQKYDELLYRYFFDDKEALVTMHNKLSTGVDIS